MSAPIIPFSSEYYKLTKKERIELAVDRLDDVFQSVKHMIKPTDSIANHRDAIIKEITTMIDEVEMSTDIAALDKLPAPWMSCDEILRQTMGLIHMVIIGVTTNNTDPEFEIAFEMLSHLSPTLVKIMPSLCGVSLAKTEKATKLPELTDKQLALN